MMMPFKNKLSTQATKSGSILSGLLLKKNIDRVDVQPVKMPQPQTSTPPQTSEPSKPQKPYIVPAIATSLVQDLTKFSNEQLAEKLPIIDINFTCKVCRAKKTCLNDLMEHLESGVCQKNKEFKRPRGRPRKHPKLAPGEKPPPKPKVQKEKEKVPLLTGVDGRRTTRMSTGALKRKNIAHMLGLHRPSDEEDSDEELEEEDNVREETDVNDELNDLEGTDVGQKMEVQASTVLSMDNFQSVIPIKGIGSMSQTAFPKAEGDAPFLVMEVDEINTVKEETSDVVHNAVIEVHQGGGDAGPSVVTGDSVEYVLEAAADACDPVLKSEPEPTKKPGRARKVSLIPQTVMDMEGAQGPKNKPVVSINTSGKGNIVIPSSTASGDDKQVVIPKSLLLEALKEHKKTDEGNIDKTVVLIKEVDKHPEETPSPEDGCVINENVHDDIVGVQQIEVENGKDPNSDKDLDSGQNPDSGKKPASGKKTVSRVLPGERCIIRRKSKRRIRTQEEKDRNWRLHQPTKDYCRIRCPVCLVRYFRTRMELEVHMDAHVLKSLQKDDIDKMGNEKGKKAILCTLRDLFKCPKCTFQVNSWSRMLRHLVSHDVYREKLHNKQCIKNIMGHFPCPVCKKVFDRKWNLISHIRLHEKSRKTCDNCGKVFEKVDKKTFKRHVDICRNVILHCDQCDYKTPVSANLRKHKRIHTDSAFTCEVCGRKFCTKQRYVNHMVKHDANRTRYRCEVCKKVLMSLDALKKHVKRLHSNPETIFQCEQCTYSTKIRSDLLRHVNSVHNKKYKCPREDCKFMTNSEKAIMKHEEYHQPDRVHPCTYPNCYFRGVTTGHLAEHRNSTHNVNSKFQCPVCQKEIKTKTQLLRHLVSHTGEKPYSCHECNAAFSCHSTYYRHRKKTGHDRGRHTMTSVPQNIIITCVQEGREDATYDINSKAKTDVVVNTIQDEQTILANEAGQSDTKDVITAIEHLDNGPNLQLQTGKQDVVFVEAETQFLEQINIEELTTGQQVINGVVPNSAEVIKQLNADVLSDNSVLNQVSLQVTGGEIAQSEQILDNIITVPGGEAGQQYTYILSTQEAENIMASDQLKVEDPTSSQIQVQGDLSGSGQNSYLEQQESLTAQTETVVEVTPPGGGQQYAILLMPSASDEPEAALSMLQLQSS